MKTLYLDPGSWDLAVDASRCIAFATGPYCAAQTVANASRLWGGEAPFNADRGIPYETDILGKTPAISQLNEWYRREAMTVPNIESATPVLQFDRNTRELNGQIQCSLTDGTIINV